MDEVAENRGTEEVSREYLNYLYSDDAQRIAAENYYRPVNQEILEGYSDVFDLNMELKTIDDLTAGRKCSGNILQMEEFLTESMETRR